MYYERSIAPVIQKINETFPVLIVTGPRQDWQNHIADSSGGKGTKNRISG